MKFFILCALYASSVIAADPTIAVDISPSVYSTAKEGIAISGKRGDEYVISKPVNLPKDGEESDAIAIGVILKKDQKALFTAELQIRDSWNNSNSFNCVVKNKLNGKSLFGMNLNAIEYNVNGHNQKTGSPINTTGEYKWSVTPAPKEGAIVLFEVTCKGWTYGYKPNVVLHLSRVIFE